MVIGIPCDRKMLAPHMSHCVGEKYIQVISEQLDAAVVLIPAIDNEARLDRILPMLDGIVLAGSYSNVAPHRYQQKSQFDGESDEARDELSLQLITLANDKGIPVLGICRGMQEINVAFGGSLHQQIQLVADLSDHREDKQATLAQQYAHAHGVTLVDGGWLATGYSCTRVQVNSLHQQGIARIGQGLKIEAVADDGLIEAVSGGDHSKFLLGVQWHPEWQPHNNPFYQHIFTQFKAACCRYNSLK
jgi:putative glutamine amidotransferase